MQLTAGRQAPILNKIEERVQVINLVYNFIGAVDPERCQRLLFILGRIPTRGLSWFSDLLDRTLGVKRSRGRVGCSLRESSRAIGSAWSLEVQEVDSLLAVEALFHRVRRRFDLFLIVAKSFVDFANGVFLVCQLADEEPIIEFLDRGQGTGDSIIDEAFGGTWSL